MGAESQGTRSDTLTSRKPGGQQQEWDVLMRTLLGQLIEPPKTPISVPMQQGISNLQSGAPWSSFGLGGGLANRLSGGEVAGPAPGGFAQGSLLPTAEGGQQGLQTREQLGLPDPRSQMGPFLPTEEDIRTIGLRPVRTPPRLEKTEGQVTKLENRLGRLTGRLEQRQAAGKPSPKLEQKVQKLQTRQDRLQAGLR